MKDTYTKDSKFIYILGICIIIFLVFAIIAVFSMNIYAMTGNEQVISNNISIAEDIQEDNTIKETDDDLLVIKQEEQEDISNDIKSNSVIEHVQSNSTMQNTVYTAPNGEKYTIIGKLGIPSLGINYSILSSTSTELLKISVNKYWGPNPNEVGNMCIVGHNYRNAKFFSKLPTIKNGATVNVTDLSGRTLKYTVYDTYTVEPGDTSCTSQLTNGQTEITLITCCNNNKQRFIVKARAN